MSPRYEAVLDGDGQGGLRLVRILEDGRRLPVLTVHANEGFAGADANLYLLGEDFDAIEAVLVAALERGGRQALLDEELARRDAAVVESIERLGPIGGRK